MRYDWAYSGNRRTMMKSQRFLNTEYYSADHLQTIEPYLPREPKWLLLGGPADANEAQYSIQKWPNIKIIGVDPNPRVTHWQRRHGWPEGHPLITAALYNVSDELLPMADPGSDLRHASGCYPDKDGNYEVDPSTLAACLTVTWDDLDKVYGPFEDAILWMDIEGSELEGVQGAEGILSRGAVMLVNVEQLGRVAHKNLEVDRILTGHGFKAVKDWNWSPSCWDRIWVKE